MSTPPGETDLPTLLRTMKPLLHPETYVWLTIPTSNLPSPPPPPSSSPAAAPTTTWPLPIPIHETHLLLHEPQGLTLVLTQSYAESHREELLVLTRSSTPHSNTSDHTPSPTHPPAEATNEGELYTYPSRKVTLQVHSSLAAVGFMAHITSALAREGVSVNPVSGFFHDHLFVQVGDLERVLDVLGSLGAR